MAGKRDLDLASIRLARAAIKSRRVASQAFKQYMGHMETFDAGLRQAGGRMPPGVHEAMRTLQRWHIAQGIPAIRQRLRPVRR